MRLGRLRKVDGRRQVCRVCLFFRAVTNHLVSPAAIPDGRHVSLDDTTDKAATWAEKLIGRTVTVGSCSAATLVTWPKPLLERGVEMMRSLRCFVVLGVALFNSPLMAESVLTESFVAATGCDSFTSGCDSCTDGCDSCGIASCIGGRSYLFPQSEGGIKVHGWINGGFIGNTSDPGSKFNGPYNAVDRSNELTLNQAYLVAEKSLPAYGKGIGFRLDALYGEDFLLAESIGMEKRPDGSARWNGQYYGLALPQAYVSLGNKDLSLQLGHFYSVVGYEGVMAPDNFFYSKSYSYQFAGPFTQWGGQMNWNVNDALTVQLGIHNGWDALDRVSDDPGFIGKVRYDDHSTGAWTSFALTTGKEFNNGAGLPITQDYTNRSRYSWLVGLPLTCRVEYVFHHWLGFQEDGSLTGDRADWYGVDQYLYYTINDRWKAGFRFEWFRDEDGTRVGLNRTRNPNVPPFVGDFYSLSAGLNWTPCKNFVLRPEVRADWYDGNSTPQPYNDGFDDNQLMLGVDAIVRF